MTKAKTIESVTKRFKVIYDVQAVPNGLTVERLSKLGDSGWLFYDSNKGNRPKIVETGLGNETIELGVNFVDTKGVTVDYDKFEKQLNDKDYWDRQLYKCKNSPLYYFKEFGSLKAVTTSAEETEFLSNHNLLHTSTTSDAASKEYKEMMGAYKEFSDSVTIESLKFLKPKMDAIREIFQKECDRNEAKVRELIGTTTTDDKIFREKVVSALCKIKPADLKTMEAKNSLVRGRWDKPVLRHTDTYILCNMLLNN